MTNLICKFTILIGILSKVNPQELEYRETRDAVIEAEARIATGGTALLSPQEEIASETLLRLKSEEIERGVADPGTYAPSEHFFKAKPLIEESEVFKFIKSMPKGAVLHAHNIGLVSSEWFIKNLTYYPGIMKCTNANGLPILTFRKKGYNSCTKIAEERSSEEDANEYDQQLEKLINLYTPTPESDYSDVSKVWGKFQEMLQTVQDAIHYLPVFRNYHWRLLEEMYDDGVMYIELRMLISETYDDLGKTYNHLKIIKELNTIVDQFKLSHPNFLGAKIIFSAKRSVDPQELVDKIGRYSYLRKVYPNFVIGFDLVGQEDLGKPILSFFNVLSLLPKNTSFFFHAGATNWHGSSVDENLLDALLLSSKRIGHGFAVIKHPIVWNAIKNRDIAIEINPISNQVLNLVSDLRNHPAAFYVSESIPIVISNDIPGFWNAKGVSYDYYYAFMCFTSAKASMKTLKTLVFDSLKYSYLTDSEKEEGTVILQRMWDEFIDKTTQGSR